MAMMAAPTAGAENGFLSVHTLGVEEELFVVDPVALNPVPCDEGLLGPAHFGGGQFVGEMCDGVVELVSPVCRSVSEAVGLLGAMRAEVAEREPVALIGAGVHPTLAFGDVRHRTGEHYDKVGDQTRSLLRQTTYCGVHVHVGMPDRETQIAAFNGMRKWVPLLQALSANSPFWHGQDSGLASARTVVNHSLPRSGLPRAFRDWADFEAMFAELRRVAEIDDTSSVWWDMRPHHAHGTLEVRGIDAQASPEDLAAIVALVHCLACHEALTADAHHPSREVLDEAQFRAIRDGLEARISTGGPLVPVCDLARHAVDIASGYAAALGCVAELGGIERILVEGNGAVRQRRAFERGGLRAVLELLRDETAGIAHPGMRFTTSRG